MYITAKVDRRKTPESELAKIIKAVKKGLNPIAISTPESVKLLRQVKPSIETVFNNYIYSKNKGMKSQGTLGVMSDALTETVSVFTFNSKESQHLLRPDILQHKSYLYNLMEARTNTWIATEGQESFLQVKRIEYNLKRIGQFETITHILGAILYIDEYQGLILRFDKRYEEILDIVVDTYWGTADVVLPTGEIERFIEGRQLLGKWVQGDKLNTPKNKAAALKGEINTYRKVEIKPTKKQLDRNPNLKTFNMRSSHLIALSCFGFDLLKHCMGSAALLSVYCKDRNTLNLSNNNLAIICKSENTKSNSIKDWHYDWVNYKKRLLEDRLREKDKLYYILSKG